MQSAVAQLAIWAAVASCDAAAHARRLAHVQHNGFIVMISSAACSSWRSMHRVWTL